MEFTASEPTTLRALGLSNGNTDMTRALSDAQRQTLVDKIPLGRLGTPQEVAHAVAFLASPEAGYITGATLHVNGGMYMT